MPKRLSVYLFIFLSLLSLGFALYCLFPRPKWQIYRNSDLGIEFSWSSNFEEVALTDVEEGAGMFFKIDRAKPEAEIFLRCEGELGPYRLTGKPILDYLVETIDRVYPQRFPDYKKEDRRRFVLDGRNAEEFTFTYKSPDGKTRIRQRYIIVVKDDENIAFFLSLQAPEKGFLKSEKDFDRIIKSFEFLD